MINYVEIRGSDANVIGIIDTAISVIWRTVYYGVGDFELQASATPEILALLQAGRYITRPDTNEAGIIEQIHIPDNVTEGATITASGRFYKSVLDRRIIYQLISDNSNKATILRGNVEAAVREVVKNNAIACPFDSSRNIPLLSLGAPAGIELRIVDANGYAAQKQVSYENLLTYTDGVLEEYGIAAKCILQRGGFQYVVYSGVNRSVGNTDGNTPVIFSKEYDNLTSSEYTYDETTEKNVALIGGAGEGLQRFYSLYDPTAASGLQRRELFIDGASIGKTYKEDDSAEEQTYSDSEYKQMLDAKGAQDLATMIKTETFDGVLDVTNGNYVFGHDFELGDIVTVQNNNIGKYINVRIVEALEYQDDSGYNVEVKYQ